MLEKAVRPSRENFRRAAKGFGLVTEEITGVPVPLETIQQWEVLCEAVRIIDNRIDTITDRALRQQLSAKMHTYLHGEHADFSEDPELEAAMHDVRTLAAALPDQGDFFLRTVTTTLKVTEAIKQEEKIEKFRMLTRLEGQLCAKALMAFLSEDYADGEKRVQLCKTLKAGLRSLNVLDTFYDLPEDYREHQSRIPPTLANRTMLLWDGVGGLICFLRQLRFSSKIIFLVREALFVEA